MSQQTTLCHNKDQAELKPEMKIVATFHDSITTYRIEDGRKNFVVTKDNYVATQNSESALKGITILLPLS